MGPCQAPRELVARKAPITVAQTAGGHGAEHVADIGLGDAPDRDLWRYALDHDAVAATPSIDAIDHPVLDQVRFIEHADGAVGVGAREHHQPVLYYTQSCIRR
jgi:hypothetical protein